MKRYNRNEQCPTCGSTNSVGVWVDDKGKEQKYCFKPDCSFNKKSMGKVTQPGNLPEDKFVELTGIPLNVFQLYRVTQEGERLYFGRATPEGKLHSVHVRDYTYPKSDKSNHFKWIGDGHGTLLYGMDTVGGNLDAVLLTEGFMDAVAAFNMTGIPSLSVPNGVGSVEKSIKDNYQFLRKFKTIYIVFDNDEEGQKAATKAATILGYRSKLVILPQYQVALSSGYATCKDSYDFQKFKLSNVYKRAIESAQHQQTPFVYDDSVDDDYEQWLQGGGFTGWSTGIPELDSSLTFRKNEFSVLFGSPGRGKSSLVRHFCASMVEQGVKPYFLAFEEPPQNVIDNFIPLLKIDEELPPKEKSKKVRELISLGRIPGKVTPEVLQDALECAIVSYGCRFLAIDHLTWLLDISKEPVAAARQYLHVIGEIVKEYDVHVIVVSHNKPADNNLAPKVGKGKSLPSDWEEYLEPTMRDSQWSSGYEQLAWVIMGWKNPNAENEPGRLYILKDRRGGMSELGQPIRLYYDKKSRRFIGVSQKYAQVSERRARSSSNRGRGDTVLRQSREDSAGEVLPTDSKEQKSLQYVRSSSYDSPKDERLPTSVSVEGEKSNNRSPPNGGDSKVLQKVEANIMEPRLHSDKDGMPDRDKGKDRDRLPIESRNFPTTVSHLISSIEACLSRPEQENAKSQKPPVLPVGRGFRDTLVSVQPTKQTSHGGDTQELVHQLFGRGRQQRQS